MKAAPVVYVWGDEAFLVDLALREIEAEALPQGGAELNREVFEAPDASPSAVANAAKTLPFLGGRRLVFVKGAHQWPADAWQPLIPYIESPNPSTCLVFVAATLDRRTKAGKVLEKRAQLVECRKPTDREMPGWAERLAREAGLKPGPGALEILVYRVGPDLQLLSQEIEKLRVFAGKEAKIASGDVEALVGQSRGASIFALCDALGARDLGVALRTLRRLLELGEPPVKVLFMIHRHFRNLWMARELHEGGGRMDRQAAAKTMGVPPFAVEKLVSQAKNWPASALRGALSDLLATDLALKTGGGTEVLDGLLLGLAGPQERKSPGRSRGS